MNFKDITSKLDNERMQQSIPDRMRDYEFIKIDSILNQNVNVTDYALYESNDTVKYSAGNTKAVHIIIEIDGKMYRTSTHGKRIVQAFEFLEANGGITEPIQTAFTRTMLNNNQSMLDFKF